MHPWDREKRRIVAALATACALACLLIALVAHAAPTTSKVLVLTSATAVVSAAQGDRGSVLIQNRGPNSIFCAVGYSAAAAAAAAVVNEAHEVAALGGTLGMDARSNVFIYCVCSVAQTGSNWTIATEMPK